MGGDEFIILLRNANAQGAEVAADKLLGCMHQPCRVGTVDVFVTASIGLAVCPDNGTTPEELLKNADTAMFTAKRHGRNNFRFFRPEMNFHVNERVRIENGLRNAIRHDEFTLHYQPQVDITRNRVVGVEALLRWNSKEGNVPPAQFIPFAEDSGMIMEIGEWVLRTACRDARVWQDTGAALCVAVNISGRQLHHAAFVETIRSVLDDTGLDPAHLELEITEGILMQDIENTISKLQALNDIGVRIAMDDFGTGYSSMISLKRLPFDRLKIDRCFIEDIAAGETVIVSAMVGLGLSLGLDVVAEGVETAGQIEFLKETGCGKVQGYYFARPMPLDNLRLFLQGWPTRSMAS
jgi:predicted signal transduction protein with EAL and GGDEF domain